MTPLLTGFLALVLGVLIGWLARGQRTEPAPDVSAQLGPIRDAVNQLGGQLTQLEKGQATTQASLVSQVQAMTRTSHRLTDRTDKLVNALRSPNVRGRWGEMQLERVVELGGMQRHCDFSSQVSTKLGDKVVRPDMVINLAGNRQIVVDAKTPFSAYLDAMETEDPEEHAAFLRRHAHLLRTHIGNLAHKDYTSAFYPTPEFVVAFVPADPFLDAALSVDPELLDYAYSRGVVVATPSSLFALLRTVALGWRQEDITEQVREIQHLGRQLQKRLKIFGEHYARIGHHLEKTVESFNASLGSLDSRVLVTARRLAEINADPRGLPPAPESVSVRPRALPVDLEYAPDTSARNGDFERFTD
ncbi:DNA recombination protein RmuC [Corynebacterium tapiri]|uniref:DNA recombination protein RmuC n=1 Tax=Corynebacterium tapiri TaxID=1448266 RepID=A0A5C4U6X7_9CORY|nr:DNA recombination protein RmuC [Corynebacterium tapiri]TNM00514.1 DNA recombination protein RmuC [Corynebacterium tapiri]